MLSSLSAIFIISWQANLKWQWILDESSCVLLLHSVIILKTVIIILGVILIQAGKKIRRYFNRVTVFGSNLALMHQICHKIFCKKTFSLKIESLDKLSVASLVTTLVWWKENRYTYTYFYSTLERILGVCNTKKHHKKRYFNKFFLFNISILLLLRCNFYYPFFIRNLLQKLQDCGFFCFCFVYLNNNNSRAVLCII